jgi:hypothetical protein
MYKRTSFVIMAAVLLPAIVTLTLYTFNRANAQGNAEELPVITCDDHEYAEANPEDCIVAGSAQPQGTCPDGTPIPASGECVTTGGEEQNVPGGEEQNVPGGEEQNMINATKEMAAVGSCVTIGRGDAAHAIC